MITVSDVCNTDISTLTIKVSQNAGYAAFGPRLLMDEPADVI